MEAICGDCVAGAAGKGRSGLGFRWRRAVAKFGRLRDVRRRSEIGKGCFRGGKLRELGDFGGRIS
jgi:hypothetical protein